MNVVFLGATKGMGRALARRMAERGDRVFLLGRRPPELERAASDLSIRGSGEAVGFAEWISMTYGNRGIRVSVLCPQAVRTERSRCVSPEVAPLRHSPRDWRFPAASADRRSTAPLPYCGVRCSLIEGQP